MTIKANMDFDNQYCHDVTSSFNSSPPSTNLQMNNSGSRISHSSILNNNHSQQMMTNTNNEMITYHNNHQIMGQSKPERSISRDNNNDDDDDDDYISFEDIDELDKDLAEIMNGLLIPTEMKQERSIYSEYGPCGSSNNSQTQTQQGPQSYNGTNISNNNINNSNKKMRKKKRKKSKSKLEKEGVSYDPPKHLRAQGNVQISKNLTENIIPSRIAEPIEDIYRYMDKLTALHCIYNDMTLEINNNDNKDENIMILNYGFHDKDTHKILYCIAEKQDISNNKSRGYKWRIINRLFTCDEIENEYHISSDLLPKTYNQSFHFKSLLNYQSNIEKLLYSDSIRTNMINNCPWHKIEIYHRTNNKRRLTLSLTKPEFMKSMQNCTRSKLGALNSKNSDNRYRAEMSTNSAENIKLIPILLFDNDQCQYLIEFVWILEIEPEIDIGISFKYIANTDSLKVTGIHLDPHFIKNQHQLIDPQHDCHCLDSFNTTINMMAIGNPDDNINKIKYYKQQIDELQLYKEHLIELLTIDTNRREHVIQSLRQKTGIGSKSSINNNKAQRMMMNQNQNQYQNQYNNNNNNNTNYRNMNQQRQSPQPVNTNINMNMNMGMNMNNNMNRFPVNHCQAQRHPQQMMPRMQQQQQQRVIAGNQNGIMNRNTMSNNVNYNQNINNMYASNVNRNSNNNNNNNNNTQNLFNPIYHGMGTNNNWQKAQMSMYPKQ